MAMYDLRKIKKVGGSHVIALPGWWLKSEGIRLSQRREGNGGEMGIMMLPAMTNRIVGFTLDTYCTCHVDRLLVNAMRKFPFHYPDMVVP